MANPILAAASNSSNSSKEQSDNISTELIGEVMQAGRAAKAANSRMIKEVTALAITSEEDQKKLADSNRAIQLQTAKAKLHSQQSVRNIAKSAEYEQALMDLAVKQTEYIKNAIKQTDDVIKMQKLRDGSGGILAYIGAGVVLPKEKREAAAANKAVADTGKMIQTIEASTSATAKTLATLEEVHTEATVQAIDDAANARYQIEKAGRAAKLSETNAKALVKSFDLTAKQLEVVARLKAEDRLVRNEELRAAALQKLDQNMETLTDYGNIALIAAGKTPRSQAIVQAIQANPNSEEARQQRADAALGAKLVLADPKGHAAIANNPIASYNMLSKLGNKGLALPSNRNMLLEEANIAAQQHYTQQGVALANVPQEQYETRANTELAATLKREREAIRPGGGSTASAASYSILMKNKAVSETPLHVKILSKLSMADTEDPTKKQAIDEQRIWYSTVSAVIAGELTIEEATDSITTIFRYANEYDNILSKWEEVNLEGPTTYNAVLDMHGGKKIVDLTEAAKVTHAIISAIPQGMKGPRTSFFETNKEGDK